MINEISEAEKFNKKYLLETLEKLKNDVFLGKEVTYGICFYIYWEAVRLNNHGIWLGKSYHEYVSKIMNDVCVDWCNYSDDPRYPVAHPDGKWFGDIEPLDFYTGEYGRRRMELVQRMINRLRCVRIRG